MSQFYALQYKEMIRSSIAWEEKARECLPAYIEARHKMLDELEAEFGEKKFSSERWPITLGNYSFRGFDEEDICFEFFAQGWAHADNYYMPASFIWAPLATIDAEKQKIRNKYLAEAAERERRQQEAIEKGEESERAKLRELIKRYPELAQEIAKEPVG